MDAVNWISLGLLAASILLLGFSLECAVPTRCKLAELVREKERLAAQVEYVRQGMERLADPAQTVDLALLWGELTGGKDDGVSNL